MQDTPQAERVHIGIFGRRNAGKSSLMNALTGQETALVSPIPGTTTDPVSKAMEILPLGPVLLIDTAGLDDSGELGRERVRRSLETLPRCDLVLLVVESGRSASELDAESEFIARCRQQESQVIAVFTRTDEGAPDPGLVRAATLRWNCPVSLVSSTTGDGIHALRELIAANVVPDDALRIIPDRIAGGQLVVLVVPIDTAAPKGRLILPQVQTIRDLLDRDALALVVKERELPQALIALAAPPALVVTDSQAFQKVAADTPPDVPLTSFSILFARYKGDLGAYLEGIRKIGELRDGDRILIAEACTHHVQADDIGTVKIPRWLRQATGKELVFEKKSGKDFPADLGNYALVIHCGGCMLNRRAVVNRINIARSNGVPITNYGMVIAWSFGILERALAPFPEAAGFLGDSPY